MSSPNCCFLTCIQVSLEACQVVWYAHLFQNFPQFIVIHTVKGFGIVNKAEINVQCKRNPSKMVGAERGHQRADRLKPQSQTTSQSDHMDQACLTQWNQVMLCGATQNGGVMVGRSDRMWSTREENGKSLQYSCLENPKNSMKMQKDRTLKDELPRSVGA